MNDAQQIYAVFYAIFWGAVFNVLGRWKPFNFGLIFDKEVKHVSRRILLSLLILNIFPILYFASIFYILGFKGKLCEQQWKSLSEVFEMVLSGVIPAFGIIGFYHLWLYFIERKPRKYYINSHLIPCKYKPYHNAAYEAEPGLEKLGIEPSNKHTKCKNLFAGLFYILLGFLIVLLSWSLNPLPFIILISIIFFLIILCLFVFTKCD